MLHYQNPNMLFYWLLILYFGPMMLGYLFGKFGVIRFSSLVKVGQKLADPFTIRAHQWLSKYKTNSMKEGQWLRFFGLIFINNLFLAAFVTRVLYGTVFFIPLMYTIWTGFSHGSFFSTPKGRPSIPFIFEFGGYLLAAVVGVRMGITLLTSVFTWTSPVFAIPWVYALASLLFLFLGAAVETLSVKSLSQYVDFDGDLEKKKEEFIRDMERMESSRE